MKKYKYIKVSGSILWGENTLTKDMLGGVASGFYDTIINIEDMTQFNADENEWQNIKGTD